MHGRRGTGVERRKRGHGWYQSSACYILFFLSSLMPCGDFFFFPYLHSLRLLLSSVSCTESQFAAEWSSQRLGSASPSSFLLLHTLSGPAGSWPDAPPENSRWHMAARAQMTGRVTRTLSHGRQLAPVTPLHRQWGANTTPLEPFVVSEWL